MRVLVTGAHGFAGKHVVQHLLDHTDWKIVAVDITDMWFDNLRVDTYIYDLRTQPTPNAFGNIDVVIHLAASSDVPSFLGEPDKHVLNNVMGTVNMLQWSLFQNLQMFIQVSTNEVYGPSIGASREWDPLIPATPYSASKAAQEMMAIAWHQAFDVPSVIVNTSHLYGEGQSPTKFIPTVVRNTLRNESVPIYGLPITDEWSASVRNWTYVGDFAHALLHIIKRGVDGNVARWNAAGLRRNCYYVAEHVAELLELPLSVEWQDCREARSGYEHTYILDTTAIEKHGFIPYYGFDAGLKRTVDWYRGKFQK